MSWSARARDDSPTDPRVRCRMQETYVKGEGEIDRAEMHNRYKAFCESRGIQPKDLANFGKIVKVLTPLSCLFRVRHVRAFTQRALLGSLSLSLDASPRLNRICFPMLAIVDSARAARTACLTTPALCFGTFSVLVCGGSTHGLEARIRVASFLAGSLVRTGTDTAILLERSSHNGNPPRRLVMRPSRRKSRCRSPFAS